MKLPNLTNVVVPAAKSSGYLLSDTHPEGKHKAVFFRAVGFSPDQPQALIDALLAHAAAHDVSKVEASPFGTRYVVEGIMKAPDGRAPLVRTVWFVRDDELQALYFVTAYPLQESTDDA